MPLTGKTGEELLHEVAGRYVEGMKDMDGRKPGPSSILGKPLSWLKNKRKNMSFRKYVTEVYGEMALTLFSRSVTAEAWTGRRLSSALQPGGDRLWSGHEVHVHWTQVRY